MICSMVLLHRQFLAGELFPAQLEDSPLRFFHRGKDRTDPARQDSMCRVILRQGPWSALGFADQDVLAILRLAAKEIQDSLQIAAVRAIHVRLELAREIEASGIDAKGHARLFCDFPGVILEGGARASMTKL